MSLTEISPDMEVQFLPRLTLWNISKYKMTWWVFLFFFLGGGGGQACGCVGEGNWSELCFLLYSWESSHIHSPRRWKLLSHMRLAAAGPPGSGPLRSLQECCRNWDFRWPVAGDAETIPLRYAFGYMQQTAGDTQDIWVGWVILWVRVVSHPLKYETKMRKYVLCMPASAWLNCCISWNYLPVHAIYVVLWKCIPSTTPKERRWSAVPWSLFEWLFSAVCYSTY